MKQIILKILKWLLIGAIVFFPLTYQLISYIVKKLARKTKELTSDQLTTNFYIYEFESKDGSPTPAQYLPNIKKVAKALQVIRDKINSPIKIHRGYSSPGHNKAIGGATASQHLTGSAADFSSQNHTPKQIEHIIKQLMAEGKIPKGGLKAYASWVHYDIRGTYLTW